MHLTGEWIWKALWAVVLSHLSTGILLAQDEIPELAPLTIKRPSGAPPATLQGRPAAERLSEGAFDAVGSFEGPEPKPPGRPLYPYDAEEPWYGHDADVESWGDLLELPHVHPGWFANADLTIFKAHVNSQFTSGTFLDGTFPGDPVRPPAATLDWNASPRVYGGYRFEHGLGEILFSYRYFEANGVEFAGGIDPGGDARLTTGIQGNVFDLDFCFLEFNSEGLPFIPPMAKDPGRMGLGQPLASRFLCPPLEMRWTFGLRGSNLFYESIANGPTRLDRVMQNFWGYGFHFGIDLNQRLPVPAPLFLHMRLDGSGVFTTVGQIYSRTDYRSGLSAIVKDQGTIGVPTATLELGLSWVPEWENRFARFTVAYQYEEWFTFADISDSNAYLNLHGLLLRSEFRF